MTRCKIFLRPVAERDIESSALYIDNDNPHAADEFVSKVRTTAEQLAEFPKIGRECGKNVTVYRFLVVGYKHWVVYTFSDTRLEILRVVHTSRDFGNIV